MEQNRKSRNQPNLDTGIFLYFREELDFSVNHAGTTSYLEKKIQTDLHFTPFTRINPNG